MINSVATTLEKLITENSEKYGSNQLIQTMSSISKASFRGYQITPDIIKLMLEKGVQMEIDDGRQIFQSLK
jgi:hypothetical protein